METYNEFIQNILNTRGRFACGDEYHERHHILPRCMGGGNEEENLIDLYAKEHFIAHKLLSLENPDNDKLIYAWTMMTWAKKENQERYQVTPEEYEEAKIIFSKTISEQAKERLKTPENNPMFGKHHTEEAKQKMRENSIPSEETRKKMSESAKARCTDEWKSKMSEINKGRWAGENNPNYKNGNYVRNDSTSKSNYLSHSLIGENNLNYGNHSWAGDNNPRHKNPLRGSENGRARPVIQLTKDLKFIKRWDYISEAANFLGKGMENIVSCCKYSIPSAYGYIWIYEEDYLSGEYLKHIHKIVQYDLDGNFIKIWDCVVQAAEKLGVQGSKISSCCEYKCKTAGGFIWRYIDNINNIEIKIKIEKQIKIYKFVVCIENNIIYKSAAEASIQTNIDRGSICACCIGTRKTAGGYHWRYLYDQTRKDGTTIPGAITLGLITEEEALKILEDYKNM